MKTRALPAIALAVLGCGSAWAQFNSGSTGRDGAFNPTRNIVVDMADHPDGIYHYTSVYIPANVTVTFTPNANNTPVVWLVQSNVVILGTVDISGQDGVEGQGGRGGPGGYRGGNGGTGATPGQGPGGGAAGYYGEPGAFGTLPVDDQGYFTNGASVYGSPYLLPLVGGSGGGGASGGYRESGGGGGGGALSIAASGTIQVEGTINASGGDGARHYNPPMAGGGSGGAVRLVATRLTGRGTIDASGGYGKTYGTYGGYGRVRFDVFENAFGGPIYGVFSQGSQFVLFPTSGQLTRLRVMSVGGVPVSETPTGQLAVPDAVLSAQQNNPIPVVVRCERIPLGTTITVIVKPSLGAPISATGVNNAGTFDSSTATVLVNIPRGGGWIYATATVAD